MREEVLLEAHQQDETRIAHGNSLIVGDWKILKWRGPLLGVSQAGETVLKSNPLALHCRPCSHESHASPHRQIF